MITVRININPISAAWELWILDETHDMIAIAEPQNIQFTAFKKEEFYGTHLPEPTIRLDHIRGAEFLKAITEAADRQGIKPESNANLEGKLEAISYHLEDLRTLLELDIKNTTK